MPGHRRSSPSLLRLGRGSLLEAPAVEPPPPPPAALGGTAAIPGHRRSSPSPCFGWDGQPLLATAGRAPPPASAGMGSLPCPPPFETLPLLRQERAASPGHRRSSSSPCFSWDGQPLLATAGGAPPPASTGMGNLYWPPPVEPFPLLCGGGLPLLASASQALPPASCG
ncbi:actin nucleation-promoting factor WASL-like [Macrobrachium nipponense]|uniref:actin nucleation-promoting factor WASL-like n=1 Tax=Macrobrachium nipponense TaxID=159736 RepID=UPI0030C801A4